MSKPVCTKCKFFHLTYDYKKPYSCKAMGFKSKNSPAQVVRQSSGMPCQLFEDKFFVNNNGGKFYG